MTEASRWSALLGSAIAGADVRREVGSCDEAEHPQRIDPRSANGRLVQLRSGRFVDGIVWETCADHVTGLFDGVK